MVQLQDQPTPDGSTQLTEDEIHRWVMGSRPRYSLGLGYGVVAPSHKSARHTLCDSRVRDANERAQTANERAVQAMREVAEAREAAEEAKKDATETKAALSELQKQMAEFSQIITMMRTTGQGGAPTH